MPKYRITGLVSYATSDPNGDPKPFGIVFEAADDAEASLEAKKRKGPSTYWEKIKLVRIDIEEETSDVAFTT